MRTLLIDGDIIAFMFSYAGEQKYDWGDDVTSSALDDKTAFQAVDRWVVNTAEDLKADKVEVALSDPSRRYWRHEVYPKYKSHRIGNQKPTLLSVVKDYMQDRYKAYIRPTLEADDVLGILATHPTLIPGEKVIVTGDKDLNTIPGLHFNPRKKKEGVVSVTEVDADFNHMYQTLVGDTCDGFPGCPGTGPVKAKKVLDGFGLLWPEFVWEPVVKAFEKKGLTEADALVQAQIARICRHADYNYAEKRVILWTPPCQKDVDV